MPTLWLVAPQGRPLVLYLLAIYGILVLRVDLVPFWTLAVLNVYRKWKQITVTAEESREHRPALPRPQNSS